MPPFDQNKNKQVANKVTTPVNNTAQRAPANDRYLVRQEQVPKFNFDAIYEKFKNPKGGLIFTKILSLFPDFPINNDDHDWKGITKTRLDTRTFKETITMVVIGTQKLPEEISKTFGWGVESSEHEYAVKAAHEIAHVYQKSLNFEYDLRRYKTEGARFKPSVEILKNAINAYIYLYGMLELAKSGTGKPATGLASLSVYHAQTLKNQKDVVDWGHTKDSSLDQQIIEDITEILAAYSLGEDYFNFRLNNMNIAEGQKSTVEGLVKSILPL